jgi:hypothetical protein
MREFSKRRRIVWGGEGILGRARRFSAGRAGCGQIPCQRGFEHTAPRRFVHRHHQLRFSHVAIRSRLDGALFQSQAGATVERLALLFHGFQGAPAEGFIVQGCGPVAGSFGRLASVGGGKTDDGKSSMFAGDRHQPIRQRSRIGGSQ